LNEIGEGICATPNWTKIDLLINILEVTTRKCLLYTFIFSLILASTESAQCSELESHVVRSEKFWGDFKSKSLTKKVNVAPPELIDFLELDNKENGWKNKPLPANPSPEFLVDISKALTGIPEKVKNKLSKKVVGIFLVQDLGGTAYSEYIFNNDGSVNAGFIVLDVESLQRKANEWATWKESSPFNTELGDLNAIIASPEHNTRAYAIQYILLHEMGHILQLGIAEMPGWGNRYPVSDQAPAMTFLRQSWRTSNKKYVTIYDEKWNDRKKLAYYSLPDKKLPFTIAIEAYKFLSETNFPTLYAATNPFDDFAESFANYIHTEVMGKPWKIILRQKGSKILELTPCWKLPRCKNKRIELEKIIYR
jgi:hypothetical protein